jgi:hypothetical protein
MSFSKTPHLRRRRRDRRRRVGFAYAQSTSDTRQCPGPGPAAADTSQPASNTAPPADTSTMPLGAHRCAEQ